MKKQLFLIKMLWVVIFIINTPLAISGIQGAYGLDNWCPPIYKDNQATYAVEHTLVINYCTISPISYLPHDGYYRIRTKVFTTQNVPATPKFLTQATSNPVLLDASKSISDQYVTVTGSSVSFSVPAKTRYGACTYLVDDSNTEYQLEDCGGDGGGTPLPPGPPPPPPTSCVINNGNALNINFNTVERATLPTVPGSGTVKSVQLPVACSGGVNVTVNMQLNYTPIAIGGTEVVKSSSNGLGVSIIYNDKPLSTTDTTPVTFISGSNTLDLAFEAVRDPAVDSGDIPTGAFSASAVLVMTQQ